MTPTHGAWKLALGVVPLLALAACTSSAASQVATVSSGTPAATPTASPTSAQDKAIKWAQCMRDNGVQVEDPTVDGDGKLDFKRPDGVAVDAMERANDACKQYREGLAWGKAGGTQSQDKIIKFAQCMRVHGVTDYPDAKPAAGGGFDITYQGDKNSPRFQAARKACASIMQDGD